MFMSLNEKIRFACLLILLAVNTYFNSNNCKLCKLLDLLVLLYIINMQTTRVSVYALICILYYFRRFIINFSLTLKIVWPTNLDNDALVYNNWARYIPVTHTAAQLDRWS